MRYCKKCTMPDTRPGITFDSEGVCSACRHYENRKNVDWDARYEVPLLTVFHHPIGGICAGRFHCLPCDASFLLNLIADTGILLVREPVAQLIQHIVQMLLQRFTLELFLNGHSPAPVDPEDDLFLLCHLSHQPFPLLRQAAQWQRKPLPPAVWTA